MIKIKKNKRKKIIILSVLFVILIGTGTYAAITLLSSQDNKESGINYDPPSQEQQEAGRDIKKDSIDSDQPAKPSEEDDTSASIEVIITSANQNGDLLQIRTAIQSVHNGECTLHLAGPNEQTRTYTVPTQALASNSSCQGFDIPLSELNPGQWAVEVTYTSEQGTGTATQTIGIE